MERMNKDSLQCSAYNLSIIEWMTAARNSCPDTNKPIKNNSNVTLPSLYFESAYGFCFTVSIFSLFALFAFTTADHPRVNNQTICWCPEAA